MPRQLAAVLFGICILGLFSLCRSRCSVTSGALWLPVTWLFIGGSRNVGEWLQVRGLAQDAASRYLDGNPLDRAFLGALMAVGFVVLVRRRERVLAVLRGNVPVLLFLSYCLLSTLWSEYPIVALKRWSRTVGDVVMVLIVLSERDWVAAMKKVLMRAGFLLVPLSVLFIRYYPELGRTYSRYEGRIFFTGVSTDKNGLGMICMIFGVSSIWCLLTAYSELKGGSRRRELFAHGTIFSLITWLIVKADSATAIACLVISVLLMLAVGVAPLCRRPGIVHVLVAGAVATPLYALFGDQQGAMVGALGRDPTLTGRTAIWDVVLRFVDYPFIGAGFESFWLGERLERILEIIPGLNQAHNGYLEIYLNLGLFGILLLAALVMTGYRRLVLSLRTDYQVGRLRLAMFVIAILYNMTEAGFKMMSPVWIMFVLTIMARPNCFRRRANLRQTCCLASAA
jgi:O-antigen ligase